MTVTIIPKIVSKDRTAVDVSERHERARIRHDNFRTLKTDKCNEKADAGADCQFKLRRNGIDDFFPQAC